MKKTIYLLGFCALLFGCIQYNDFSGFTDEDSVPTGDVHFWQTTGSEYFLFTEIARDYSNAIGDLVIELNTSDRYQQMDGFGGTLTGSSAYLIRQMDDTQRKKLLYDLFDPKTGAGINYLRITIGSCDFSLSMYTYCDQEGLENFAIPDVDKRDLIPVLKEILAINSEIKIMATPWSPPAWMKNGGILNGGTLLTDKYDDFADYFVKYIKAMENEGIKIDAISLQNEAMFESTAHPSMKMVWQEQSTIIREYVGPKFKAEGITAKILLLDHNFDEYSYPINILNDPQTRQFVAGTAFHGYAGSPSSISEVVAAHPDKDIYFTEQSGGGWNTGLDSARMVTMFHYMNDYLIPTVERGSKNFLMWNIALNTEDGPTTPGGTFCEDCRGVVTISPDNSYRKELEYYLLGHFSKVCRSGAVRIGTNMIGNKPDNFSVTAFLNPDGSKGVVLVNQSGNKVSLSLKNDGKRLTYEMPNDAVISFLL